MSQRISVLGRLAIAGAVVASSALIISTAGTVSAAQVGNDDFQISQTTPTPEDSRIAYNATDEEYLVVWASVDGSLESRIYGRIIDARTGAGVTNEFLIAEFNGGDPTTGHIEPDVVWNSVDNEYVVVSAADDTTDAMLIVTTFEIYAQRVSAAGALVGGSVRVSDLGTDDTNGSFDANQPAIAHDPGNNQYLVVFDGDDDIAPLANGHDEIFGQLLTAALAVPVGAGNDVRLTDMGADGDGSADARTPAVAWDGSQYLVVWEGDDDSLTFEIHGQYVNADGTESGPDFLVSTDPANDEAYDAAVAADTSTGDVLVVWEHDNGVGNDFEIEGAFVNGGPGTSFPISEVGNDLFNVERPAVAYHPVADAYSVVWTGDHSTLTTDNDHEVFHVLLAPSGAELEAVEQVSSMTAATTQVGDADVAAGPETASGIVWSGVDTPATDSEVWGQFVAPDTDLTISSKVLNTPATVMPGDPVEYLVSYANDGDVAATNVTITDMIPAGITISNVVTTGPPLTQTMGETYEWTIANLPANTTGTITLTGTADSDADGLITNTATISGNPLHADSVMNDSASVGVTVDVPPSVTVAAVAAVTNTSPVSFTAQFSEDVTGFADGDVDLSASTAAGMLTATVTPVDGANYTIDVTGMTGDGDIVVTVPADSANDIGPLTQGNTVSNPATSAYDATAPTVTVEQAVGQTDPTNSSPISFVATFSEDVTGFGDADVTLGGTAGATTAVVTGGPAEYTISVSGMTGDGTVTASIGAAVATDGAGNTNVASTSTDNVITYDTTAPTVTVEQAAGQADPTSASPINFTATFDEDVTGFGDADVTLGGTAGATTAVVTGGPAAYTIAVSGMTGDGTVTASVGAGVANDLAGNGNAASTSTDNEVTYDATAPTVTIEQGATQTDSANASPIVFDVVLSEDVTGFDETDVTLDGSAGATTATVTPIDGANYTVEVSGMTGNGTVIATIDAAAAVDAAGNDSGASTSTDNMVTFISGDPTPGVNDAPSVTAAATATAELAVATTFTGADAASVTDPDALDADIVVTVTTDDDETIIEVVAAGSAAVAGNAGDAVTITGSQSDINATLASLSVTANNVGDITITIAADDQGNTDGGALTDSATTVITVTDTVAPTITAPDAVTASADPGEAGAIVTFDVTVDDPGSESPARLIEAQPAPTLDCDPNSGSFFPIGDTTVTCTATDASGNSSTESFVVTVTDDEDPVITGATDQQFTLPLGTSGVVTYTTPTASDNSGSATITCTPASGSTLSAGETTVNCTAADASGNTASASFTLDVVSGRIPDTGGSLTFLPWAGFLLGLGVVLLGSVGVSRRRLTR